MEPSHTSLNHTPAHQSSGFLKGKSSESGGRWSKVNLHKIDKPKMESTIKDEGCILLLSDPDKIFKRISSLPAAAAVPTSSADEETGSNRGKDIISGNDRSAEESQQRDPRKIEMKNEVESSVNEEGIGFCNSHVLYRNSSISGGSYGDEAPRRGDLVTFGKTRGVSGVVKDLRIIQKAAATMIRGRVEEINIELHQAVFAISSADDEEKAYSESKRIAFSTREVVSCSPNALRANELVEGILHEGLVYGGK